MIRQNHRGLLSALSLLMVGSASISEPGSGSAVPQRSFVRTGSNKSNKGKGASAKRAEKARRQSTRRNAR